MVEMKTLVSMAIAAREHAYAPYSHYHVGAAVLTEDGEVFTGSNVENAVYPATCCAEQVAIFNAVSHGHRHFSAIAVATENGGSPCGICRQVMSEFAPTMQVFIADKDGKTRQTSVDKLLPDSFGATDL